MSDFFGKLKSGAGKVAFEAEKMNRLNRARGELEKIKSQVQAQFMKLGELYYNQRGTVGVTGTAYDEICQEIMSLESQSETKNNDIQRINAEVYSPQVTPPAGQAIQGSAQSQSIPTPTQSTAQPATVPPMSAPASTSTQPAPSAVPAPAAAMRKFCPNCGKELSMETKFCPDCGAKV
jgi:membrane protease subunit (stomatin/prohibitin family)